MKSLNSLLLVLLAACAGIFLWMHGVDAAYSRTRLEMVVEDGDTLWSIAARWRPEDDPRLVIREIMALNDLDDAMLRPGQRLIVPAAAAGNMTREAEDLSYSHRSDRSKSVTAWRFTWPASDVP